MANKDEKLKELLVLAKQGDETAVEAIVDLFTRRANALANRLLYSEKEDMVQEGLISLLSAIESFDSGAGVAFNTYATRCMQNAMLTVQKKSYAQKRSGTKLSLSDLDEESLTSGDDFDPQQIVTRREAYEGLIKLVDGTLSGYERTVLSLHLQGYSYSDISSRLNKPQKSVDNALQRVRKKLKSANEANK